MLGTCTSLSLYGPQLLLKFAHKAPHCTARVALPLQLRAEKLPDPTFSLLLRFGVSVASLPKLVWVCVVNPHTCREFRRRFCQGKNKLSSAG